VDPEFAKKIAQRDAGWRRVVGHACMLIVHLSAYYMYEE